MKAVFLAESQHSNGGLTKIRLVDVNAGEGLTDFRAGSQRGDLQINVFGDQTLFQQGKAYLLEISEFVQPDENTGETETPAAATNITPPPAFNSETEHPVTQEFLGKITITHDGERLMIAIKPDEEQEGEPANDTQDFSADVPVTGNTTANADKEENSGENTGVLNTENQPGASTADTSNEGANQAQNEAANTNNPPENVV